MGYEYEQKELAEIVGEIIHCEVIIVTSKYEMFVAVLETDRHFNVYGGDAEDVASLIYNDALSYWNDEVAVFIDGEFKSVEELIEQLENFEDTEEFVKEINLIDVEINDMQHQVQRMKPIIFSEVAKLFEKLNSENEFIKIVLGDEYIEYLFAIYYGGRYCGTGRITTGSDTTYFAHCKTLQREYEILKENGYIKE